MAPLRFLGLLLFPLSQCANILLEGGTVISFDDSVQQIKVLHDTSILISGNKIARIFPTTLNVSLPSGTERVSVRGKIVSPGFIDTHRHLWQTQYRTLASNTSLAEYFVRFGGMIQGASPYTPDDVYYGQLAGIYESLNAGVTSIVDHAHHTWTTETSAAGLQASIDSGARVWWCATIHDLSNSYTREQQYADFTRFLKQNLSHTATTVGLAYDQFSTDPPAEVQRVINLSKENKVPVMTIHTLGGPWLYDNSPTVVNNHGFLNSGTALIFSHGSYMTTQDALLLRSTNQYLSITPESEDHYGHGHAVSHLIQDQAALGVDTHFTYSGDIITQARFWLQRVRAIFYDQVRANWQIPRNNPMSAAQAFLLATRSGGLAVRRPDVGVLVEGAMADVVVFDGDAPNMLAWTDPVAAVVLHSNVGDVRHVIVNGEFRKRDGKLVMPSGSWEEVQQKFLVSAKRLRDIYTSAPPPVLQGDFVPGVPFADALTVDALRGPGTGY